MSNFLYIIVDADGNAKQTLSKDAANCCAVCEDYTVIRIDMHGSQSCEVARLLPLSTDAAGDEIMSTHVEVMKCAG